MCITQRRQSYYSQVDADLAKVVSETARMIRAKPGFPTQVTRRLLVAQIGHSALLKSADVAFTILPLTSHALKVAMETDIAFVWRKLRWAVQSFLTEQAHPTYYIFLRRARISPLTSEHPIYKQLIQFAYSTLRTGILLNEQVPEDLITPLNTVSSENENFKAAASGSLASVCMNKKHTLLKRGASNSFIEILWEWKAVEH